MRRLRFNRYSAMALAGVLLALPPAAASAQEVALVATDAKEVAKGYRADELKLRSVVNDKGETIGHINDFIFSRDNGPVFVVLSVGDFVGLGSELVAVPFKSLKLDEFGQDRAARRQSRGPAEAPCVPPQSLSSIGPGRSDEIGGPAVSGHRRIAQRQNGS